MKELIWKETPKNFKVSFWLKVAILLPPALTVWALMFGISLLFDGDWQTKLWATFLMTCFASYVATTMDGGEADMEMP